jgi:hypothetical protein
MDTIAPVATATTADDDTKARRVEPIVRHDVEIHGKMVRGTLYVTSPGVRIY